MATEGRFFRPSAFAALASLAFRETLREPAYVLTTIVAVGGLSAAPWLTLFSLGEEAKLLADVGLSVVFGAGAVLACLGAGTTVRREVEAGTLDLLFVKPVTIEVFLLAKAAGICGALLYSVAVLLLALLSAVRQGPVLAEAAEIDWPALLGGPLPFFGALAWAAIDDFRGRKPFAATALQYGGAAMGLSFLVFSSFGPTWELRSPAASIDLVIVKGCLASLFAAWVTGSLAAVLSLAAGRAASAGLALGAMAAGFLVGAPEGFPGLLLSWLPDTRLFWTAGAVYGYGPGPTWTYLAGCGAGAVLHAAGYLFGAACLWEFFRRRT